MASPEGPLLTDLPSNLYSLSFCFCPEIPSPRTTTTGDVSRSPQKVRWKTRWEEQAAPRSRGVSRAAERWRELSYRPRWVGRKEAGQRPTQRMKTEWRETGQEAEAGLWVGASEEMGT